MTAAFHTRATAMSRPGHHRMIAPYPTEPRTEAAKANHARRLRAMIGRMGV